MIILSFDVGIVNLAYCIYDSSINKILHWEVISLENTKDHSVLHLNLIKSLDSRTHLIENTEVVLIEKQPSFNPKMRIIAGCLQTYFFIRGMIDSNNSTIKSVKFFSPKNKLKCHSGEDIIVSGKSKYLQTKKAGIMITKQKLEEYSESEEIIRIFENSKKKDDLADCYLQAITYSHVNSPSSKPKISNIINIDSIKKLFKEHLLKNYTTNGNNREYTNITEIIDTTPDSLKQQLFKLAGNPTDIIITLRMKNLHKKKFYLL